MRVSLPFTWKTSTLLALAFWVGAETPLLAADDASSNRKTGAPGTKHTGHTGAPLTLPTSRRSVDPSSATSTKPVRDNATESRPVANTDTAPGSSQGAACPEGMQLIDGDYCTRVEHKCAESWYDESNKKTVCERFEPWSKCSGNRERKRFCMDRYEYPNRAGERPEVMNRFHQAEVKCAALGKRLCTETEWTMACEGPKYKPFPYGYVRDTSVCHGDVMWDSPDMHKVAARDPSELARLWKGVRSGSQPECVSEYGVYDMPGNADEVVASETYSADFRGKFDSVHTGGPWYKGVRNQCRPKIYTHDEGFYYYFLSFRCCAEPDRKTTDPRTPKQRKANWKFDKVEKIAGFTRQDVQKALRTKTEKGNCGCKARDTRCNTLCGTLLGPEARDFQKTRTRGAATKPSSGSSPHDHAKPSHESEKTGAPAGERAADETSEHLNAPTSRSRPHGAEQPR